MNHEQARTCDRVVELFYDCEQGSCNSCEELDRIKKRISYRNLLDYLCTMYEVGEAKRLADEIKPKS